MVVTSLICFIENLLSSLVDRSSPTKAIPAQADRRLSDPVRRQVDSHGDAEQG